jgi:cytochrome c553
MNSPRSEHALISFLRGTGLFLLIASTLTYFGGAACVPAPSDGDGHDSLGEAVYTTAHVTTAGESLSCEECHGHDGNGGPDPAIRGSSSSHLQSHAQGGGTHPAGVKYADLTHEDLDALAEFHGGSHDDDHDHDPGDLVGDPVAGQLLFTTALPTVDGVDLSCSNCHRQDGGGAGGPSVLGQSAEHLMEHAQGTGGHPEGIKYPELTAQDFADMAAFLAVEGTDDHDGDHE